MESRAAGSPSDAPTAAQLKELFVQIDSGRIIKTDLQQFLRRSRNTGGEASPSYYRNLTGCTIRIIDEEGETKLIMCPESGAPAEVYPHDADGWTVEFANGFRAPVLRYNRSVTNLPPPREATYLIVTKEVAAACQSLSQPVDDLLVPDDILHEDENEIIFRQFRSL